MTTRSSPSPRLPTATWHISLDAECPACHEYVDLLDAPDFWDGQSLGVGEHMTERSKAVEVECPKCKHEWLVDLEY